MRKFIKAAAFVAVALASGTVGAGGTRTSGDVSITQDPKFSNIWIASGALGSVRYEVPDVVLPPGTQKHIGCKMETDLDGFVASCWAYKPTGNGMQQSIYCISDDPAFIQVVGTLNGDSWLQFSFTTTDELDVDPGTCTSITVENSSQHYPKVP